MYSPAQTTNKELQDLHDTARRLYTKRHERVHVRPFNYRDWDYQAIVAIRNAIEPETPSIVAEWKHWDENRPSQYCYRRYVVEKGGHIVAVGSYGHQTWSHHPDKYTVDVHVHPDHQNQGIGAAFYDFLRAELEGRRPQKLVAFTRENRPVAIRFLRRLGFHQVMRVPVSRLDTATFDAVRFADKVAQVAAAGIEIRTLRQLDEEDPDWKHKVYELEWECLQDVPSPDEWTKRPFEQFEKHTLGSPNLLPDAWFVAVDGEQYVGLSVLWKNLATDKLLETGLTGVVRSHRRLGVATALKVHAIRYAQEHGNATIETDNEENNPMFQLNLQLGFVPQPAYLDFAKTIERPEQSQ